MYTDKLYIGQREMEGLGIYHYKARFYSPALGRFIQPDSIIPGAADPQSWNRYSYVLNNPIRYNDPAGHKPACGVYGEECSEEESGALTAYANVPLTHKGDPIPGSDKTVAFGGAAAYAVFLEYQNTCGWWNDYCDADFGIEEFIGMWAVFESNGNTEAAGVIATIIAQNLFVGGNNPAACHRTCFNGVFNFMAAYSSGKGALFQGPDNASNQKFFTSFPSVWHGDAALLRDSMSRLGNKAMSLSSVVSWDRFKGPSNWGNVKGGHGSWLQAVRNAGIEERNINGLAENTVYYYFGNAFYYSIDQKEYWTIVMGATANMAGNGEMVP